MIRDGGKLVASHMARTLHVSHADTARILAQMDMIAAYDGMEIEM